MGTRHLVGVIKDGKWRVAQYGQWDGYLEGQGKTVLSILEDGGVEKLREKVDNCIFVTREQIRQYYVDAGDSPTNTSGLISGEIADKFNEEHPTLSRDMGALVLKSIIESDDLIELFDSSDFLTDDCFCEFAYVVDFDKNVLRFYASGENVFAEYSLSELPTLEEVAEKLENFYEN